jgi:multiple sugar transport system ATP-binding protein
LATIEFRSVTKTYGHGQTALAGLDLAVAEGECLVLVGPSGCGKSTTLRMVAGLDGPTSGDILIGGRRANDLAPRERNIAMVFQSYALYPHLSVADNIAFGLTVRGERRDERRRKVAAAATTLELTDYLDRKPAQLSGGQRQRVAMARALVRSPQAFLMDEPLSNLDARLRSQMREEIVALQRRTGVTTLYVTHDQVEGMTIGNRVAVLHRGTLQQVAPPRVLYDRPANRFVAGFIGSPAMNFLAAERSGSQAVRIGPLTVVAGPLPDGPAALVAGIRPEAFRVVADGEAEALVGTVRFVEDLGATLLVSADLGEAPALGDAAQDDDAFGLTRRPVKLVLAGTARLRPGETIRVTVDPGQLHLFDAGSGAALNARPS